MGQARTSSLIRRHVSRLPNGTIFTSRDLVGYGPRNIMDQLLSRLVKDGFICRLARGVFLKTSGRRRAVSPLEVAVAKATAFGKAVNLSGVPRSALEASIDLEPSGGEFVLGVSGRTTSFMYGDKKIVLRDSQKARRALAIQQPTLGANTVNLMQRT